MPIHAYRLTATHETWFSTVRRYNTDRLRPEVEARNESVPTHIWDPEQRILTGQVLERYHLDSRIFHIRLNCWVFISCLNEYP